MKIKLVLAFLLGIASSFGADLREESNLSVKNQEWVDSLVCQIRTVEFNKNSPDVVMAYVFFSSENIQNARDFDYTLWYHYSHCSVEILYGLYLALQDFLSPEGDRFTPEDLNGGFTKDNYQFLKQIFEKSE